MGDTAMVIDFRSQTITTLDNKRKTMSVMSFGAGGSASPPGDAGAKIELKETGQTKTIDGHHSIEMLLTTDLVPSSRSKPTSLRLVMPFSGASFF